jgi:TonB-linked SusC/RagA family outer membrane protein
MYKNFTAITCGARSCIVPKFLRIMKLALVLWVATMLQVSAASYAQKVSIDVKNAPLNEVLTTLGKQSGYNFLYTNAALKSSTPVSVTVKNELLSEALNQCLKGQPLSFVINGNTVIIKKKEEAPAFNTSPAEAVVPIKITGNVVDTKGVPLPGVTVKVKGVQAGTLTGANGNFTITVPDNNAVLVFSYVGFVTQEVAVGSNTNLKVVLADDDKTLTDVVVVGYGTKKKSDLTGSIASLSSDEIVKSRAPSAQEALQGRMPGVDVKRSSGKPGADMTIEIRGVNSIYGNTQPLYVVDGIPVANINDINPADIERMDVLKDASSTAIFGSRGANGVVIVTTKRGTRGKTKINYDGYVGFVNPYNLPKVMDGAKFADYAREYYRTLGTNVTPNTTYSDAQIFSPTELSNVANGNYTNWIDLIKRNGLQTNHNLSITGGDEKTLYFLSAGYQQYEGALKVENTKKYTLKVGLEKTLNDVVKIGASIYGTYADFNLGSGEVFRSAYRLRPTGSAYNADGSTRFFAYETEAQITNPLFDFDNDLRRNQYIRMLPNLFAEVNILKNLKFRSSFTPDVTFQRSGTYTDTYSKIGAGTRPNAATNGANHLFNYTLDNLLIYNQNINNDHKLEFTLGNSLNYYQQDNNLISVTGLPYRSLWYNVGNVTTINGIAPSTTVSSAYSKQNISSFFFRGNYTLKNRYLLTVTGRADGNSIFSNGNKWGFFPSAALGWVASEEDFIKNISAISFLKFRLSYGKSGNAAVNGTYFYPYVTQSAVSTSFYDFNGNTANGSAIVNLAPADLTWEKTTEYNAGMELNFLKNRIALTLDYYNKTAKGTLLPQQIPAANGYSTVTANVGSIRNSGIEIGLNTTNIKTSDFKWSTSFNYSKNNNKIIDLFGNGANDVGNSRFIGQKARVLYNYKIIGVWQTNDATQAAAYGQKPGQYKLLDVNSDGKITADDRVIQGSDIPDWFGGITSNFNYKNFDFGVTLYTRQGTTQASTFLDQAMNGDQGRARFGAFDRSYWTTSNPSNTWANNAIETDATRRQIATYQNSSYTKISNMTLGFTAPKNLASKIGMSNLRIYATAYNPIIWTKFTGWDPETADLNSFGLQDFRTRTFILGVNLTL